MKFNTYVAGVPHAKPDLTHVKVGDKVSFLPEPTNAFDPNAILVVHTIVNQDTRTVTDQKLGYVPKTDTESVRQLKLDHAFITTIDPAAKFREIWLEVEA